MAEYFRDVETGWLSTKIIKISGPGKSTIAGLDRHEEVGLLMWVLFLVVLYCVMISWRWETVTQSYMHCVVDGGVIHPAT